MSPKYRMVIENVAFVLAQVSTTETLARLANDLLNAECEPSLSDHQAAVAQRLLDDLCVYRAELAEAAAAIAD